MSIAQLSSYCSPIFFCFLCHSPFLSKHVLKRVIKLHIYVCVLYIWIYMYVCIHKIYKIFISHWFVKEELQKLITQYMELYASQTVIVTLKLIPCLRLGIWAENKFMRKNPLNQCRSEKEVNRKEPRAQSQGNQTPRHGRERRQMGIELRKSSQGSPLSPQALIDSSEQCSLRGVLKVSLAENPVLQSRAGFWAHVNYDFRYCEVRWERHSWRELS